MHPEFTPPTAPTIQSLTVVIDTNVCLDLFVFHDPRWAALFNSLQAGTLRALTSSACRNEWLAVLQYTHLPVTELNRASIVDAFDQLISCIDPDRSLPAKLPVCTDPDDQKFMEQARDCKASFLITKDKALLKCAKKVASAGLFQIVTPEGFLKLI